jgi:hypothetical protein
VRLGDRNTGIDVDWLTGRVLISNH